MRVAVSAENYQREVLNCKLPVLVEFYDKWCSKCAMMEDIIEEIAGEYDGIFQVCQIEIGESAELAKKFKVEIVPTFVVFKEGEPVTAASGLLNRETLIQLIFSENHS